MDIAHHRLSAQHLIGPHFNLPEEVVRWFGAVQAQEYKPSQWALALRMGPSTTQTTITNAIESGAILRTWLMRGTIHFATPQDASWMLHLLARRNNKKYRRYFEHAGLTDALFNKGREVLVRSLQGGQRLTRKELYTAFEQAGISSASKQSRGTYILQYWAQEGLVAIGPYRDKQPTFVLLEEWAKNPRQLSGDEALQELAIRYFTSHGPATAQDFAWWSGLSMPEARQSIHLAGPQLTRKNHETTTYFYAAEPAEKIISQVAPLLLPCFDEYTVAYKNRSAVLEPHLMATYGYAVNNNVVIIDGKVAGQWKVIADKELHITLRDSVSPQDRRAVVASAEKYSSFREQPIAAALSQSNEG